MQIIIQNMVSKVMNFREIWRKFEKYFGFEIEIGGESGHSTIKSSGIDSTRTVDTPRYQEHCLTPNILGDTMRSIDPFFFEKKKNSSQHLTSIFKGPSPGGHQVAANDQIGS